MRWCVAMLGALLVLACAGPASAPTASVATPTGVANFRERPDEPWKLTATAEAAPTSAIAIAAPIQFASGGLGLHESDWEQEFGRSTGRGAGSFPQYQNTWSVLFDSGVKHASHIEREWPANQGVTFEVAQAQARPLLPSDAQFVRTSRPDANARIDLYRSPSLAGQFPPTHTMPVLGTRDTWHGEPPGTFTVIYETRGGRVQRLILGIGNNP